MESLDLWLAFFGAIAAGILVFGGLNLTFASVASRRQGRLAVEIDAIPERALIGRHRAPREWPGWCLEGWRALAAAYPEAVPSWAY